jgi:hypothetical protein
MTLYSVVQWNMPLCLLDCNIPAYSWLIDYCLSSSEQYFSYIQNDNKYNNIYKKMEGENDCSLEEYG